MTMRTVLYCYVALLCVASQALARPDQIPASPIDALRLKSIYTEEHSLTDFKNTDTRTIVFAFMGIECPVVRQYIPRINWQRTYELETPLPLAAGVELVATAYFDNSKFNPNNPDPSTDVYWGLQTTDEMFSTRIQYRLPKSE
jgi:hypothetical protein